MSGYVFSYRKIWESGLFKGDAQRVGVWQWMLHRAAWKPTTFDVQGVKITLRRGELCASQRQICEATGMSRQRLRTFLKELEANQAINQASTQGKMVLTICNYDRYQAEISESTQPITTEQPTKEKDIPIAKAIGHTPIDPLKIVFDEGVRFMGTRNIPERQARAVIGKWRKDHPVDDIAKAISNAARESAVDPISYIQACLGQSKKQADKPKDGDTRTNPRTGENEVFDGFNGWLRESW